LSSFTYTHPNEEKYYKALIAYLNGEKRTDLVSIIQGSKIEISSSQAFSQGRWNAHCAEVIFSVSEDKLGKIDNEMKNKLITACDLLIPDEAGLDVMNVEFILNMDETSLVNDLHKISEHLSNVGKSSSLPNDMLVKAEEMSESYLYMFSIENYIRLFIHEVAIKSHGESYFNKLNIPKSIKNSVTSRKTQEAKNQWLSVRGDSELFYLDFKDLSDLITNNWSIFKDFFPDQAWISSKINELGNCRNLIAHNSYLGNHERDIIRVNFQSLIRQMSIKKA